MGGVLPSEPMRRPWYRDPVALVVDTLAVARLTRLVTADTWPPAEQARRAVYDRVEAHAPGWGHGIDCPWCMSPWIAAAVVALHETAARAGRGRLAVLALLPLAISTIVGTLAEQEIH